MPIIDANLLTVINSLLIAITAIMTYLTRKDMASVKHETNSMKDALVAKVGEAADAQGFERARRESEAASQQRAEGRRQEREKITQETTSLNINNPNPNPVPVKDDRTAVAAERSAAATERVATATEDKESHLSKKV